MQKIVRHSIADRLVHWLLALATLVLLGTGFLPVVGLKFEWVTIHWSAGLFVFVGLLWHLWRRLNRAALARMWVGLQDLKLAWQGLTGGDARTGKYSLAQKLMHHGVAFLTLITLVTGLLMMVRIDTPFWERNIYLFSDETWGIIYVCHGLAAMATLTTVMLHIYFAVRPEKLLYLRSMIGGHLSAEEYAAHHDPALWAQNETSEREQQRG